MPGKKKAWGGKRTNAGRKPILDGKRYHIMIDEGTRQALDTIIAIKYPIQKEQQYKRSEMIREIVMQYSKRLEKTATAKLYRERNRFNDLLIELLSDPGDRVKYLPMEFTKDVNRLYRMIVRKELTIEKAVRMLCTEKNERYLDELGGYFVYHDESIEPLSLKEIATTLFNYCKQYETELSPL